jgi:hypothetical protein
MCLSRRLPSPAYWRVRSSVDCVPTPPPGHFERLSELRECLISSEFGGQFRFVGVGAPREGVEGGRATALALARNKIPW